MQNCMIALKATMLVPPKCSGQGLAHCNHSVAGRWVVSYNYSYYVNFSQSKEKQLKFLK